MTRLHPGLKRIHGDGEPLVGTTRGLDRLLLSCLERYFSSESAANHQPSLMSSNAMLLLDRSIIEYV